MTMMMMMIIIIITIIPSTSNNINSKYQLSTVTELALVLSG